MAERRKLSMFISCMWLFPIFICRFTLTTGVQRASPQSPHLCSRDRERERDGVVDPLLTGLSHVKYICFHIG